MSRFSDDVAARERAGGGLHLLEWARRRVPPPDGNAVRDLLDGKSDIEIAARRGLPIAAIRGHQM